MTQKRISDRGARALTRYLREIPDYSQASADVDPDAGKNAEELILSNLHYVVKIAGGYRNRGVPFEDLLNEGNIGLMHAASRYDHRRGVKFTCYASWWIKKSLRAALDEQGLTIRVPEYQRRKAGRLKAQDEADQRKHGHPASAPRCMRCGPAPQALRLHRISLHSEGNDEGDGKLLDSISIQTMTDPLKELVSREDTEGLHQCINRLTPIEREVIEGRFGLEGDGSRTLRELGATLGLSRERIRQIEAQAKAKLRTYMMRSAVEPKHPQAG